MVSTLNYDLAQEIYQSICVHSEEPGGMQVQIVGKPGCGKTTVLMRTVPKLFYYNRADGTVQKETVIWRARTPLDYWNYFLEPDFEWEDPKLQRPVHVFRHEDDKCSFQDEGGHAPDILIHEYKDTRELIGSFVKGAINVVYEPREHYFSSDFIQLVRGRGMKRFRELEDPVDGSKLWYELFYYLLRSDRQEFITIVMDEADEVFHANPIGVDWHLHIFVMNSVRDFRKAGISFLLTYHTYGDIDWMITTKIGVVGWMKGRPAPGWSQTSHYYARGGFHNLAVGEVIWESHGFGNHRFAPIKYRKRVLKIERERPKNPDGRPRLTDRPARIEEEPPVHEDAPGASDLSVPVG